MASGWGLKSHITTLSVALVQRGVFDMRFRTGESQDIGNGSAIAFWGRRELSSDVAMPQGPLFVRQGVELLMQAEIACTKVPHHSTRAALMHGHKQALVRSLEERAEREWGMPYDLRVEESYPLLGADWIRLRFRYCVYKPPSDPASFLKQYAGHLKRCWTLIEWIEFRWDGKAEELGLECPILPHDITFKQKNIEILPPFHKTCRHLLAVAQKTDMSFWPALGTARLGVGLSDEMRPELDSLVRRGYLLPWDQQYNLTQRFAVEMWKWSIGEPNQLIPASA